MQAFRILCKFLSYPSPEVFLYLYSSWPDKQSGWLSLIMMVPKFPYY